MSTAAYRELGQPATPPGTRHVSIGAGMVVATLTHVMVLRLQKLVLRNNQLTKIENLEGLTSLRELDLYDNQITALENLNLPSLTYLNFELKVDSSGILF